MYEYNHNLTSEENTERLKLPKIQEREARHHSSITQGIVLIVLSCVFFSVTSKMANDPRPIRLFTTFLGLFFLIPGIILMGPESK